MNRSYWHKWKGTGRSPLKVVPKNALTGFAGGAVTITLLCFLTDMTDAAWIMAPFGASCVLAFGIWDAPLSQPRNIIGGHLVSTFVGLCCYHSFGDGAWVIGLATGTAIAVMMLTKTTHPPAGADPIVVIVAGSGWSFLFTPVLIGSVLVVLFAIVINNMQRNRSYPVFWY